MISNLPVDLLKTIYDYLNLNDIGRLQIATCSPLMKDHFFESLNGFEYKSVVFLSCGLSDVPLSEEIYSQDNLPSLFAWLQHSSVKLLNVALDSIDNDTILDFLQHSGVSIKSLDLQATIQCESHCKRFISLVPNVKHLVNAWDVSDSMDFFDTLKLFKSFQLQSINLDNTMMSLNEILDIFPTVEEIDCSLMRGEFGPSCDILLPTNLKRIKSSCLDLFQNIKYDVSTVEIIDDLYIDKKEDFDDLTRIYPMLKSLQIKCYKKHYNDLLVGISENYKKLERLEILIKSYIYEDEDDEDEVVQYPGQFPVLQSMKYLTALYSKEFIKACPNLIELTVHSIADPDDLITIANHCPSLKLLSLEHIDSIYSDEWRVAVTTLLEKCPVLRKLDIKFNKFINSCADLSNNPLVDIVSIPHQHLSDIMADVILFEVDENDQINVNTDRAIDVEAVRELPVNATISILTLVGFVVNDQTIEALSKCSVLTRLFLESCRSSEILKACPYLQFLEIITEQPWDVLKCSHEKLDCLLVNCSTHDPLPNTRPSEIIYNHPKLRLVRFVNFFIEEKEFDYFFASSNCKLKRLMLQFHGKTCKWLQHRLLHDEHLSDLKELVLFHKKEDENFVEELTKKCKGRIKVISHDL